MRLLAAKPSLIAQKAMASPLSLNKDALNRSPWRAYALKHDPMTAMPFSGSPLDRAGDKRTDADWLATQLRDANSLVWPFWQLRPFIRAASARDAGKAPAYLNAHLARQIAGPEAISVLLGLDNGRAIFAMDIDAETDPAESGTLVGLGEFCEPRAAAQMLSFEARRKR
jgi:NAD+ diphosphatase